MGGGEGVTPWVQVLVTKLDDLTVMPKTHKVEEGTDHFQELSSDLHVCSLVCTYHK